MTNLKVELCGLELKNPIMTASGTSAYGEELSEYMDVSKLGAIVTSGITLNPKKGNPGIRLYETPAGMMNSIGLDNPGVEKFIDEELPAMGELGTIIIANLGGNTLEEYLQGIKLLNKTEVDIIELNISCPNVKEGGMAFGIKEDIAYELVKKVRSICKKPLIVKLSPNAENIVEMAKACEKAGADGLTLVNTFNALAIDIYNRKPVFHNITAGLSGPAIKPIALRMVYEVSKSVAIPIVGVGGITSAGDVLEYIMAGATAVQIGSGNFIKPDITLDIIRELEEFMEKEAIESLEEIRGII